MNHPWGVRSKLWLEYDGKPVMGEGRKKMLRSIHRNGSMKLAAGETGISYRRLRGAIHEMENILGYPLVTIQRGGGGGGGARLTQRAHNLLDTYDKISDGFHRKADDRFRKMADFFSTSSGRFHHSHRSEESNNEDV